MKMCARKSAKDVSCQVDAGIVIGAEPGRFRVSIKRFNKNFKYCTIATRRGVGTSALSYRLPAYRYSSFHVHQIASERTVLTTKFPRPPFEGDLTISSAVARNVQVKSEQLCADNGFWHTYAADQK
jgi:hypothetical protein